MSLESMTPSGRDILVSLFDDSPNPVLILRLPTDEGPAVVLRANAAAIDFLGDSFVGRTISDSILSYDRAGYDTALRSMREAYHHESDVLFKTPKGTVVRNLSLLRIDQGGTPHILAQICPPAGLKLRHLRTDEAVQKLDGLISSRMDLHPEKGIFGIFRLEDSDRMLRAYGREVHQEKIRTAARTLSGRLGEHCSLVMLDETIGFFHVPVVAEFPRIRELMEEVSAGIKTETYLTQPQIHCTCVTYGDQRFSPEDGLSSKMLASLEGNAPFTLLQMITEEDLRHQRLLQEFREVLRDGGLFFLYQPIIDVLHGTLAGLEALVHWDHPVFGRLGPRTILPIAEELGLLGRIETWKVDEVFQLDAPCPVHLNLSTQSLLDGSFREFLLGRLRNGSGRTVLELTENTSADLPQEVVTSLLQANIKLCIDQFGLGQSSVARLAALPFSSLKIDQSFVARCAADIEGASVCIGIIKMSRGLNLDVISDGVTHPEQARILFRNGCHLLQGDWLSRPVSLSEAVSLSWDGFRMTSRDKYIPDAPDVLSQADISTAMLLELDAENQLIRIPSSFSRFSGYPSAALHNRPFTDLVPEGSRQLCLDFLGRLQESGRLENAVLDLRCADGALKCVSLSGAGASEQDASTYLFVEENEAYGQKVMDLRGMQGAYSILFDDNPMATVIWRHDFEILDWNREATATFGWNREEAVGRNLFKLILRDDTGRSTPNLLNLADSDNIVESVSANLTKDGERIICRWVNRAIRDSAGRVRFHVSIAKNITRELLLNDRVRQLSSAIEKSGNAIVVTNAAGAILWVNPRYLAMTGYEEAEVIGRPIQRINGTEPTLSGGSADDPWSPSGGRMETASPEAGSTTRVLEQNFRRKDGSSYWTRSTLVHIESAYDLETSTMSIIQDLSQEKAQEEKANIMHRKLIDQDKLATLGSMLAGITHETFNYIAYIESNMEFSVKMAERLASGRHIESSELAGALEDAREGISRMKDMLLTLKTASRREDRPHVESCDIPTEINLLLNLMKNEYKYTVNITRNFEPNLTHTGFPGLLRQVLMNLVINAVYAIKARNLDTMGTIGITARRLDDLLEISVSDDGIGMTEETRGRIFEPFFTTKKTGEGTGLGLSISRDLIENRYGGRLECASIPGRGTTFTILVPEVQAEQVERRIQKDVEEMR